MTLARIRALRICALPTCALLALPVSASAQATRAPTIFSPTSQMGTVNVRAAVVPRNYDVKPLPLLTIVALRADQSDSVVAKTDLDGRVSMALGVGTYTLRAKTSPPVDGRSYTWAVRVVVKAQRTEFVQLTNANALSADSVAASSTVASASPPAVSAPSPAPTSVAVPPTKAQQAAPGPVTSQKVVATNTPAPAKQTPVEKPTASQSPFVVAASRPPVARVVSTQPRANTSGLLLGLAFDASTIQSDDLTRSTESGAGVAAQVGWGFTKNFAMVVDASAARISSLDGDFDLAHVDVGGRWHFVRQSSGFVPFVEVGYSGRAASKHDALLSDGAGTMYTGDLSILGSGASLGGGFQYYPTRRMAIGGALKWTTGKFTRVQFDKVTVDGLSIDATSARFNMGFTWFPMR